ncbi:retrovirus-related pol polyprotein from transposon TNT 1-94 [Tanacetum coccineum]|uniref:Retrovirus-related pol polyprotein from transposon TNT 1-94 n=1 Tax=Tanacetum coccineum TaxID=301880 RepID=A0ABQ4Z534_9ASTR
MNTQYASNTLDSLYQELNDDNMSLEFQVLSLEKENEHLKLVYQNLFDSIKQIQAQTKLKTDSLQGKLNATISENAKLRAQLQAKFSEQKDELEDIETCLWYVNSGCSKHMTENLKLLINFVWKFMGTVHFGNDHVAAILVIVDDYSRYTWVHFLRSKDEAPKVIIKFLKQIQVLLQAIVIINGREDIRKLGAKGDIGFFIGYSFTSRAYRVYNRRTKKVMEMMNVTFDELSAMAYEQQNAEMCIYALSMSTMEPRNVKEAMTNAGWIEAMQDKLLQFKRLDVWELVPYPDNIKPLTLKWLFKNKLDEEKMVIRNKARLVVRGYRLEEGIDFKDSFSSVDRMEAIRIFLAYDAHKLLKVYQWT